MTDIQYAIENSQFSLAHFDAWVSISRALGHFWSSFDDEIMAVIRAVYAKKGWVGVGKLVEIIAPLSGWGQSFAALGGIMPPTGPDHLHTTSTGRLEISVTEDGHVKICVFRMVGEERIEIGRFLDGVNTWRMPQREWAELGGKDECFSVRHQEAVDEIMR